MKARWFGNVKDAVKTEDLKSLGGGVYIFILGDYPYYVGTAETSFYSRLVSESGSHKNLFGKGLRTYLKSGFTKEYLDSWPQKYLEMSGDAAKLREILYLPLVDTHREDFDRHESISFFEELSLLLLPIESIEEQKPVEKRLQLGCLQYYLDKGKELLSEAELKNRFLFPGTGSNLLGRVESVPTYSGALPSFRGLGMNPATEDFFEAASKIVISK